MKQYLEGNTTGSDKAGVGILNTTTSQPGDKMTMKEYKNFLKKAEQAESTIRNPTVYIVQDGANMMTDKLFEVDLAKFLNKYDFSNQTKQVERNVEYMMKMSQEDFKNRAFYEILEQASLSILGKDIHRLKMEKDSKFEVSAKPFSHFFTIQGQKLEAIEAIQEAILKQEKSNQYLHLLIASNEEAYKGLVNSQKLKDISQVQLTHKSPEVESAYESFSKRKTMHQQMADWFCNQITVWNEQTECNNSMMNFTMRSASQNNDSMNQS